jgi:hypothetical protein
MKNAKSFSTPLREGSRLNARCWPQPAPHSDSSTGIRAVQEAAAKSIKNFAEWESSDLGDTSATMLRDFFGTTEVGALTQNRAVLHTDTNKGLRGQFRFPFRQPIHVL